MRDPLSEEECRALREYIDLTSGDWRTRRALDTVDELREEVEELAEAEERAAAYSLEIRNLRRDVEAQAAEIERLTRERDEAYRECRDEP